MLTELPWLGCWCCEADPDIIYCELEEGPTRLADVLADFDYWRLYFLFRSAVAGFEPRLAAAAAF